MPFTSVDERYSRYGGLSSNSKAPSRSSTVFSVESRFSTTNWNVGAVFLRTTNSEPSTFLRDHACWSRSNPYSVTWLAEPRISTTLGSVFCSTLSVARSLAFSAIRGFFCFAGAMTIDDELRERDRFETRVSAPPRPRASHA